MKVNTDGVLLGAAVSISSEDTTFLDIGTGTGLIALMLAQRKAFLAIKENQERDYEKSSIVPFIVEAVEIDSVSAEEARQNFEASPWAENLKVHPYSLNDFKNFLSDPVPKEYKLDPLGRESEIIELKQGKYDLIVSNPPYFENSVLTDSARRTAARHTTELSYRELIEFAAKHLAEKGRLAMILPAEQEKDVLRYGRMNSLHLQSTLRIRTVERKQPTRIIIELARQRTYTSPQNNTEPSNPKQEPSRQDSPIQDLPKDSILTIQKEGQYSAEYLSLTKDFYLFA